MPPGYVRDLAPEDLPHARSGTTCTVQLETFELKALRSKHHMLAMTLASGATAEQAAFITQYSVSTIRVLERSPMFQNLMEYYRSQKQHEFKDFHSKAAMIGMDALEELHERLATSPEEIKTKELLAIVDSMFDRTIMPKKGREAGEQGPPPPAPITVIQFIDSPHASAPFTGDPRIVEGTLRKGDSPR